jgi:ABC-type Mn2+/Zn2+ transport system permease subunit
MLVLAAALGAGATLLGSIVALWLHRDPGPLIVAIAAAGFLSTTFRSAQS